MIKRKLFFGVISALSVISCSNREDDNDVISHENVKIETNKPGTPSAKVLSSKLSEKSSSESAKATNDSIQVNTPYEIEHEPHRIQPAEPGLSPDPETIDPTKPDRPK